MMGVDCSPSGCSAPGGNRNALLKDVSKKGDPIRGGFSQGRRERRQKTRLIGVMASAETKAEGTAS